MHFIGIEGMAARVPVRTALQPRGILPRISVEFGHDGAIVGPQLHREPVRVCFQEQAAVAAANFILIEGTRAYAGNIKLSDPRTAPGAHDVGAAVPMIEGTDDADAFRVRRPNGEPRARPASLQVGTELFINPLMIALEIGRAHI